MCRPQGLSGVGTKPCGPPSPSCLPCPGVSLLQNAASSRENVGVELYGFQQNLAKLQLQLEETHQNYQIISKVRQQVRCLCRFA